MSDTPIPSPGSKEAIAKGCICAICDNNYGKGYMGMAGVFVYTEGCPVHTREKAKVTAETDKQKP